MLLNITPHLRCFKWHNGGTFLLHCDACPLLDIVGCQITSESVKSMFFEKSTGPKVPVVQETRILAH